MVHEHYAMLADYVTHTHPRGAVTKLILDWAKHSKKEQEAQRLPVGNGYQEDGMGYRRSQ